MKRSAKGTLICGNPAPKTCRGASRRHGRASVVRVYSIAAIVSRAIRERAVISFFKASARAVLHELLGHDLRHNFGDVVRPLRPLSDPVENGDHALSPARVESLGKVRQFKPYAARCSA